MLMFPGSFGKHRAIPLLSERQRGAKRLRHFAPRSLSSNPAVQDRASLLPGFSYQSINNCSSIPEGSIVLT